MKNLPGRTRNLWRGGLPPLGREAAPEPAFEISQTYRVVRDCDCFAAERGQAPSPQVSGPDHE
ncbi:hypothetical protein PSJE_24785 [Pseudomonas jessenii]|nr:hypothetical protein PSJE_24785 [Pseudomonas jessenii]